MLRSVTKEVTNGIRPSVVIHWSAVRRTGCGRSNLPYPSVVVGKREPLGVTEEPGAKIHHQFLACVSV